MRILLLLFPVLLLSFHAPSFAVTAEEAMSTAITINVGSKKVTAKLPDNINSIIHTPQDNPTYIQGTKGTESLALGRAEDFDIYTLQVYDPALLTAHGHAGAVTNLDDFVATEIAHYQKDFDVKERAKRVPEALKAMETKTDRYVLVSGAFKKRQRDNATKPKAGKEKQFLMRVLLVDGQVVVAQREIGGGFAAKNKLDPKDEKEWEFLKSVIVQ